MAAASVLVESAPHVCDYLAEHGGVNALLVSTHGANYDNTLDWDQWADHDRPRVAPPARPQPSAFIPYRPQYYQDTPLGQARDPAVHLWTDRDVLQETIDAAHDRGMLAYARHLEVYHSVKAKLMPEIASVGSVTSEGERTTEPCWHHPHYRNWWLGMTREWVSEYDLDGIILGPERDAPLSPLLYQGKPAVCFCQHCRRVAAERGVDADEAAAGMNELLALVRDFQAGRRPRDGMLVCALRILLHKPAAFAWETLQNDAKWSLHGEMYRLAKAAKPDLDFGYMVPVYPVKHDVFSRALAYDYAKLGEISDFLKINVYQDVNAARLRDFVDRPPPLYGDLDPRQTFDLMASLFGWRDDPTADYDRAWDQAFDETFIKHEVSRCLAGVAGKAKCYAGIGVDIPHPRIGPVAREDQMRHVKAAWEAGADGLLLSREFQFMRKSTLQACRDATRDCFS
jgi:hypothetical protein